MGRFARAFGLSEANERTVKITRSYTVLRALDTIALMMTIPFLFIHMADLLGGGPGQYPNLFIFYFPLTNIVILAVPFESFLPVVLIIIYAIAGVFGQIQGILVSRVFVDAIPSRVRNSVYSLMPTMMLIFSIPQITFFGWIIQFYGVPLALILCSAIAMIGVALLHKGLTFPIPSHDDEKEVIEDE